MPLEFWRWEMAERFGWTLEYIDAMSVEDLHQYLQITDAKGKAAKKG